MGPRRHSDRPCEFLLFAECARHPNTVGTPSCRRRCSSIARCTPCHLPRSDPPQTHRRRTSCPHCQIADGCPYQLYPGFASGSQRHDCRRQLLFGQCRLLGGPSREQNTSDRHRLIASAPKRASTNLGRNHSRAALAFATFHVSTPPEEFIGFNCLHLKPHRNRSTECTRLLVTNISSQRTTPKQP